MKNNNVLWKIAGLVIIIAVISSLATMALTGNVVSVEKNSVDKKACEATCKQTCAVNKSLTRAQLSSCQGKCISACSKVEVYTKAEIDAKLATLSVGSTPKNCNGQTFSWSISRDGNSFCKESTANNCLMSEVTIKGYNTTSLHLIADESRFMPCDWAFEEFDEDKEMGNITDIETMVGFQVICCD